MPSASAPPTPSNSRTGPARGSSVGSAPGCYDSKSSSGKVEVRLYPGLLPAAADTLFFQRKNFLSQRKQTLWQFVHEVAGCVALAGCVER